MKATSCGLITLLLAGGLTTASEAKVPANEAAGGDPLFAAGVGTRAPTLELIRRYHTDHGYVMDPHTAVGVCVAEPHLEEGVPMICLATAHPAKFGDAIRDATREAVHHEILDGLLDAPTRCETLPNDRAAVCDFIAGHG